MKRKPSHFKPIGLLSAVIAMASPVQADDDSDLFGLSLASLLQIEVASLFLEDELYVGSSVSRVTEDQWQQQGAEKTFEAIEHIPGVYLSEHVNGMLLPTFRGYAAPNQYNSFLVLLDGMPLNSYSSGSPVYGAPNFALGNLQSIEVIRGPGSALYGADAFNGLVSLNSWSSDKDTSELRTEAGQNGYIQGTGRARHSINESVMLTSMVSYGEIDDLELKDPYTPAAGSPTIDDEVSGEYSNITTTHKLAINDFEAAFYYSEHDVEDSFGVGDGGGFFPNGHHTNGLAKMKALRLAYQQQLIGPWSLDATGYYIDNELLGAFGDNSVGQSPVSPSFRWDSKDHRRGINVVAKKPLADDNRQIVLGVNYDFMKVNHLSAAPEGTAPTVEGDSRELAGAMGQVEQRFLNSKLQFIAGGRFDHYSDFGNNFSPRLALNYHPVKNSALKFMYGEAFRAPAVNEQTDSAILKGGGDSLKPEEVKTYELVWMQAANQWRYSVNAYLSKVSDTIDIATTTEPGFFIEYFNLIDTESYGIELDASYQVKDWTLSGNIAYNQTKQTDISQSTPGQPTVVPNNNPAYPDVISNIEVAYQLDPTLTLAVNQLHQNGRQTPQSPIGNYVNQSLSSLSRTDFHLNFKPNHTPQDINLFLNIRDVFDQEDLKTSINIRENGTSTPGRRINVGFAVKF